MAKFTQFIQAKKNRIWIYLALGVVGLIFVLMIFRGGSSKQSSSTTLVQSGPSEGAAIQQAAINAGLQQTSIEASTALEMSRLSAANEALSINRSLDALVIQEQGADRESQRAFEAAVLGIGAERDIALTGITTQAMVQSENIQASVMRDKIAAESMIAQQGLFIGGQVAISNAQNAVQLASIDAQRQVAIKHEENIGFGLKKAKKKHVGAILAGESPQLGTKTNAITGFLGGLFSDIRMKHNVRPTGERIDGIPSYTYELNGAPGHFAGVIAQELEMMAPEFVFHTPRGLVVDYVGLDARAA